MIFLGIDGKYYPLQSMVGLGSTLFVVSPEASKAFAILVVSRSKKVESEEVTGPEIITEGLCMKPCGVSSGNATSYIKQDHSFEVMNVSCKCTALIPAWYLAKHSACGVTTSHLHIPQWGRSCYRQGKIHPEYTIAYDNRVTLKPEA